MTALQHKCAADYALVGFFKMTTKQLSRKIRPMREHPPITSGFERALDKRGIWSLGNFRYGSQKEHWLRWLAEYDGPGYYGRKQRHQSAEFAYNHIVCPPMLLWLAETSGLPKKNVFEAKRAALRAGVSLPALSAAIRKLIPWEQIESCLERRRGSSLSISAADCKR